MAIDYKIEKTVGVIVKGDNVDDWESVPLWQVYRYSGSMGTAVAKYTDKKTAERVRTILAFYSSREEQ